MSLAYLRDGIIKRLQRETDALGQAAIDMRVHSQISADTYAMMQVDRLAEARALARAAKIVIEEYKRLTETPQTEDEPQSAAQKQTKETVY